jgi:hypothetical protein
LEVAEINIFAPKQEMEASPKTSTTKPGKFADKFVRVAIHLNLPSIRSSLEKQNKVKPLDRVVSFIDKRQ